MKTLIKIFIFSIAVLGGTLFAQTVNPCSVSTPTCQRFVNQDIDYLNRSILAVGNNTNSPTSATIIAEKKGIDTVNQTLRQLRTNLQYIHFANDTINQTLRTVVTQSNSGGFSEKILNTITTSTPAYASGDNVGGIITFSNIIRTSGGTEICNDITLWDKNANTPALTIDFWNASPSGTYTDNSAEVIAGDHAKWLGKVTVATTDWVTTGAVSRVNLSGVNIVFRGVASRNIYATIVTTSAITYTTTSALLFSVGVLQD